MLGWGCWLGPPGLILDWVGVAGSWIGQRLAWCWLKGVGKSEWASLISMKSRGGGEVFWPRQVMVGGGRGMGRPSRRTGSRLSHAAVAASRRDLTANRVTNWGPTARVFPVTSLGPRCRCVQLAHFKWTWRRVTCGSDTNESKRDAAATWVTIIFRFIEGGLGNKNIYRWYHLYTDDPDIQLKCWYLRLKRTLEHWSSSSSRKKRHKNVWGNGEGNLRREAEEAQLVSFTKKRTEMTQCSAYL